MCGFLEMLFLQLQEGLHILQQHLHVGLSSIISVLFVKYYNINMIMCLCMQNFQNSQAWNIYPKLDTEPNLQCP